MLGTGTRVTYFAEAQSYHKTLSPALLYEDDIDNKLCSSSSTMVAFPRWCIWRYTDPAASVLC